MATAQFEYCFCAFPDKLGFEIDLAAYLLLRRLAAGFYTATVEATVNRGMGCIGG